MKTMRSMLVHSTTCQKPARQQGQLRQVPSNGFEKSLTTLALPHGRASDTCAAKMLDCRAMPIEIRRADSSEAEQLTAIAHAAKGHWGYPEKWIEQWQIDLTITPEFIADNEVFVAIVNDSIAGCCALVVTGALAEIEHMWINPEHMGSGVGRAL